MTAGVYLWSHPDSEFCYLGESLNCEERWWYEFHYASKGSRRQPQFFDWLRKHELNSFRQDILVVVSFSEREETKRELLRLEREWEIRLRSDGRKLLNDKSCGSGGVLTGDARIRQAAATRNIWNDEDMRLRHAKSVKLAHARPEVKARVSIASKLAQNRPEVRAKRSESMKRAWERKRGMS